jgi:single-strand DNA-binding protein
MTDNTMTLAGNLVDDPELRYTQAGQPVARFRIAQTPRYRDSSTGQWTDGEPLFLTCQVWRQPAENAAETLTRGIRVIVTGKLRQRSYQTKDGDKRTIYELDCDEVGVSLRTATAKVQKVTRASTGTADRSGHADPDPQASEPSGEYSDEPPF